MWSFDNVIHWVAVAGDTLLLAIGIFFLQKKKLTQRRIIRIFWFIIMVQLLEYIVLMGHYGFALRNQLFSKYLFPPYSSYFVKQVSTELSSLLSGWVVAGALTVSAIVYFQRKSFSFIDQNDATLFILGVSVVGWPAVLPFFGITIILAISALLYKIYRKQKTLQDRLVVTPYILPSTIITLVFRTWILAFTHLQVIRF